MSDKTYVGPQLSEEQAIKLHDSEEWREWTPEQLFHFQWNQQCLAVPFYEFHKAAEVVLGRSVWSHEFASPDHIQAELDGKDKPTMQEIIGLLPSGKTILLAID